MCLDVTDRHLKELAIFVPYTLLKICTFTKFILHSMFDISSNINQDG